MQLPDTAADTAMFYSVVFALPVFPIRVIIIDGAARKCPAIPKREGGRGHKDATRDWRIIEHWWGGKYRDALIGWRPG
jgi:hypothetical protein